MKSRSCVVIPSSLSHNTAAALSPLCTSPWQPHLPHSKSIVTGSDVLVAKLDAKELLSRLRLSVPMPPETPRGPVPSADPPGDASVVVVVAGTACMDNAIARANCFSSESLSSPAAPASFPEAGNALTSDFGSAAAAGALLPLAPCEALACCGGAGGQSRRDFSPLMPRMAASCCRASARAAAKRLRSSRSLAVRFAAAAAGVAAALPAVELSTLSSTSRRCTSFLGTPAGNAKRTCNPQ
mmetsp:Transcript_19490/g.45336  ORF Transcript_19490/g.45336 Transcript_19490/m.45336 type:complete len:240 (+) Transcript_19490:51-770(+)